MRSHTGVNPDVYWIDGAVLDPDVGCELLFRGVGDVCAAL